MVTKVSGTEGVDQVKAGTLTVDDAKAGQAVGFNRMQLFAAKATTSGTSVDFSPADGTGIPSWAKRITVMLNGISTNGTSPLRIRLGASGGVETSGYTQFAASIFNPNGVSGALISDGIGMYDATASTFVHGSIQLTNVSGNAWVFQGGVSMVIGSGGFQPIHGSKALAGLLDRIRLTTVNGTDLFDAGSVSILVEGYE